MASLELTCRQVARLVLDYVEDELEAALRRRVDRHLRLCAPCANDVRSYSATVRLIACCAAERDERLPEALVASILAARRRASA